MSQNQLGFLFVLSGVGLLASVMLGMLFSRDVGLAIFFWLLRGVPFLALLFYVRTIALWAKRQP